MVISYLKTCVIKASKPSLPLLFLIISVLISPLISFSFTFHKLSSSFLKTVITHFIKLLGQKSFCPLLWVFLLSDITDQFFLLKFSTFKSQELKCLYFHCTSVCLSGYSLPSFVLLQEANLVLFFFLYKINNNQP